MVLLQRAHLRRQHFPAAQVEAEPLHTPAVDVPWHHRQLYSGAGNDVASATKRLEHVLATVGC